MTAPHNVPQPGYPGPVPQPGYSGAGPQPGYPGQVPPPGFAPVPEPQRSNGFAVAALILGIVGAIPLAIGFGIAGLVRAGKVNKGKAMSWIGIALAVLWLIPTAFVVKSAVGTAAKVLDPGCIAAESAATTWESKLNADSNDAAAVKADLQEAKQQIDDAAAKTRNADAKAAMVKLSQDFQELLDGVESGNIAPDLESRLTADGDAVDKACGRR